jgi:two-component system response regulator PhcR
MRVLLQRVLSLDFEIVVAGGAREAMAIIKAQPQPFAVVIADMTMQDGNGVDLLVALRRLAPATVRILFSGDHRVETQPEVYGPADPFRVLIKPISNREVVSAIRAAVEWRAGALPALAA